MKEADFQAPLIARLGSLPQIRVWRQLVGNFFARYIVDGEEVFVPIRVGPPKGAADISGIVLRDGRRIEVEVKGTGGRSSAEQIQWAKNMRAWNAVYVLAAYDDSISLELNVERVVDEVLKQVNS